MQSNMKENEFVDIPSDCDSMDALCDIDSERITSNDEDVDSRVSDIEFIDYQPINNGSNDNTIDDMPLSERLEKIDGIWESFSRTKVDIEFTNSMGLNVPDAVKSPSSIFLCLLSHNFIETIVDQTNLYTQQNKAKFDPVNKFEILTFLEINILMGVKKFPSYRDYWSNNIQLNDPYISKLMNVNRFSFISSNLHINDNTKELPRQNPNYDKLYKLRPMISILNNNFKKFWKPYKNQSVDESMIKFKGRHSIKQYMPAKPIKRGYKVWMRADELGFVCEFKIYTGKTGKTENKISYGLGERVVIHLTKSIIGGFHHIYLDNFFSTVNLLVTLRSRNIFACGTVRKNRKNLPKIEIPDKNMERGDSEYRTSYNGVRWIKWKDNKVVYLLSNFHDPSETGSVRRRQKDGTLKAISCPKMIYDYNRFMGFVNKADQLRSTYALDRKSKKWWHHIFWFFIDTVVTNAYIIYIEKGGKKNLR